MTTATAQAAPARAAAQEGPQAGAPVAVDFEGVWRQLEAWGNESVRRTNAKGGAGENQFGVMMGKLRGLAAQLHKEHAPPQRHALGLRLWETANADAMLLAAMLLDPAQVEEAELEALVRPLTYPRLVDELAHNVVALSPHAAALRERWMDSPEEYVGRAGWQVTIAAVTDPKTVKEARRAADGRPPAPDLDLDGLLKKIEAEVVAAPLHKQEAMTQCLVMIATHYDAYTQRGMALGEKLGRYDTRPVPKGCTAWYAPEWITAVLRRRK